MTVLTAEEAKEALNGISSRPFQSDVLSAEEAKKALRSVPKSDNREPRTYTVSKPQEPKVYRRNADGLMTQAGIQPTIKQQKQAENAARLDALAGRSQTGAQKDLLAPISRTQAIRDFTTGDIVQTVVPKAQSAKQSGGLLAGIQNLMEAANPVAKGVDMLRYLQNQEQAKAQADGIADQRIMELHEQAKTNPAVLHSDEYIKAMSRPVSLFSGMVRDIPQIDPEGKSSLDRLAPVMQSKRAEAQNELLEGKTGLGKMGTQALITGADMLGSAGLAGMTGVPFLGVMAGQSGADAGQRALDEGYGPDVAAAYATGSGAISALMEGLGGIAGSWGGKVAQKIANTGIGKKVISKLPAEAAKKAGELLASKVGKRVVGAISEGNEEFVEYYLQTALENLMLDKNTPFDLREALFDAGVGALVGSAYEGAGAAADLFTGRNVNAQAAQPAQESAFTQQAGTNANAAQGAGKQSENSVDKYAVLDYIDKAANLNLEIDPFIPISDVTQKESLDLSTEYGIDVSGYKHVITQNDVRHFLKNPDNTIADVKRIPDIISNYDLIFRGKPTRTYADNEKLSGNPTVFYVKRHNGVTYYLEQAIQEDGILAPKQLKKNSDRDNTAFFTQFANPRIGKSCDKAKNNRPLCVSTYECAGLLRPS